MLNRDKRNTSMKPRRCNLAGVDLTIVCSTKGAETHSFYEDVCLRMRLLNLSCKIAISYVPIDCNP